MTVPTVAHDAVRGLEEFLFLIGGSHTPLLYASGEKTIPPDAIRLFWRNQTRRRGFLQRRNIPYVHLIAPDKHNVCSEVFPYDIICRPGSHVLACSPDPNLNATVIYPLDQLAADFRKHCYRVDTHFTPFGTAMLCQSVVKALQHHQALIRLQQLADLPIRSQAGWSGDLGWRFDPPHSEEKQNVPLGPHIERISNHLAGGNNGMMDLYTNHTVDPAPPLGRVMLFGDSYGRDMASVLATVAREVLFLRTPYLHLDLVDTARPDIVITQGAERYLPSTLCDSKKPMFLLMPFFKATEYSLSPEAARAFSAFLTGQPLVA